MGAGDGAGRPILYGRRRGRRLRPGQRRLLETLLPEIDIPLADVRSGALDPATLFAVPPDDVWLEIGFGSGEHLAYQASTHPEIGMLGSEPFINGVATLLAQIERGGLTNVRILSGDARPLIDALPENSVGRAFLLFPDPWPKKRHHKRRFVSRDNLSALARVLKDHAEFRIATDDQAYLGWILRYTLAHPAFEWLAQAAVDWRTRPADWPGTRYERKAMKAGRASTYLRFERRARSRGRSRPNTA